MMTFEEVYKYADEAASPAAFEKECAMKIFECLHNLHEGEIIIEIGVQFGRSSTIIGLVARERNLDYYAIDNYKEDVSKEAEQYFRDRINSLGLKVKLIVNESQNVIGDFKDKQLGLVHIDGDHNYEGVIRDCKDWLPLVRKGGYACFHDFGHDSLPGVYKAVNEYIKPEEWEYLGNWHTLGVYQKKL